jgi:hypothetical protein
VTIAAHVDALIPSERVPTTVETHTTRPASRSSRSTTERQWTAATASGLHSQTGAELTLERRLD